MSLTAWPFSIFISSLSEDVKLCRVNFRLGCLWLSPTIWLWKNECLKKKYFVKNIMVWIWFGLLLWESWCTVQVALYFSILSSLLTVQQPADLVFICYKLQIRYIYLDISKASQNKELNSFHLHLENNFFLCLIAKHWLFSLLIFIFILLKPCFCMDNCNIALTGVSDSSLSLIPSVFLQAIKILILKHRIYFKI